MRHREFVVRLACILIAALLFLGAMTYCAASADAAYKWGKGQGNFQTHGKYGSAAKRG